MTKRTGNQYKSRKAELMDLLVAARKELEYRRGEYIWWANYHISAWRDQYAIVPASTRRRWKCGR
jgi:hypothetical protein